MLDYRGCWVVCRCWVIEMLGCRCRIIEDVGLFVGVGL